jgi:hypothetical protein
MYLSEIAQAAPFGITIKDGITAILIPIIAVLTTLIVQSRQQMRDRRMQIVRMLLATRHLPAAPEYNAAINLIPVEFNRDVKVISAWRDYIQQVRFKPAPGNEQPHHDQTLVQQTKLIAAVMARMGLSYSTADIQADAYSSEASMVRESIYLDSLKASRDQVEAMNAVAEALRLQAQILQQQASMSPPADTRQ